MNRKIITGIWLHFLAFGTPLYILWAHDLIVGSGMVIPPLWFQWSPAALLALVEWPPALWKLTRKTIPYIYGGRPMTKVSHEFTDVVNGRGVYTFRDAFGRYWLAHHGWAWFRVLKAEQPPGLFSLLSKDQQVRALAYKGADNVGDYVSTRVFEGTRPISPERVAQIRAAYERQHNAPLRDEAAS